jgi:hypothetical protein
LARFTRDRWRKAFGGLKTDQAKRLRSRKTRGVGPPSPGQTPAAAIGTLKGQGQAHRLM